MPRWSQWALKMTASGLNSGSLPGTIATTFRVSSSRTFEFSRPRRWKPRGMGRKSREFAAFNNSATVWPESARIRPPASSLTQPAKASAGSFAPTRT